MIIQDQRIRMQMCAKICVWGAQTWLGRSGGMGGDQAVEIQLLFLKNPNTVLWGHGGGRETGCPAESACLCNGLQPVALLPSLLLGQELLTL